MRLFTLHLLRYEIFTEETSPRNKRPLQGTSAVNIILKSVDVDSTQYQLGNTKIFIKDPASVSKICMSGKNIDMDIFFKLFLLEETRDRKFDSYARLIQKAFRKHFSQQMLLKQKEEAAGIEKKKKCCIFYCLEYNFLLELDIFYQKKQRRKHSLNRNFHSDYIGLDHK